MKQVVKAEDNHWYVIENDTLPTVGEQYLYNENNNSRGAKWTVQTCSEVENIEGAGVFFDDRHHIWCHKILRDLGTEEEREEHEFSNEKHVLETIYSPLTKNYSLRMNGKAVQSSKVFSTHMKQLQSYLNSYNLQ